MSATLKPGWEILLEATQPLVGELRGRLLDAQKRSMLDALRLQLEARAIEIVPKDHLDEVVRTVLKAYVLTGDMVDWTALKFVNNHTDLDFPGLSTLLLDITGGEHWEIVTQEGVVGLMAVTRERFDEIECDQQAGGISFARSNTVTAEGPGWSMERTDEVEGTVGELTIIAHSYPPLPPAPATDELGAGVAAATAVLGEGVPAEAESAEGACAAAPPAEADPGFIGGVGVVAPEPEPEPAPAPATAEAVEEIAAVAAAPDAVEGTEGEGGPATEAEEG